MRQLKITQIDRQQEKSVIREVSPEIGKVDLLLWE